MKKILLVLMSFMMIATTAFAEGNEVTVTIPGYDVVLNGVVVDNQKADYPFITYKEITYIPMTYDLTAAIGIKTSWNKETGLMISKSDKAVAHAPTGSSNNIAGKQYTASLVPFKVTVNGTEIDNSKEEYPLLVYKNVTYFPMTYRFMVTEFNSGCVFSVNTGLDISADKKLSFELPEPIVENFEIVIGEFQPEGKKLGDVYNFVPTPEGSFTLDYDFDNDKFAGKYVTVLLDYYNIQGEYQYTEKLINGLKIGDARDDFGYSRDININNDTGKINVRFLYEDVTSVAVKLKEFDKDVACYFNELNVSNEVLTSLGVKYVRVVDTSLHFSQKTYSDFDLKYTGMVSEFLYNVNGVDADVTIYLNSDNTHSADVSTQQIDFDYVSLKGLTDFKFDLELYNTEVDFIANGNIVKSENGNRIYLYDESAKLIGMYIINDEVE